MLLLLKKALAIFYSDFYSQHLKRDEKDLNLKSLLLGSCWFLVLVFL